MNAFFPVGSASVAAALTATAALALPSGGPMIRLSRQTSAAAVYIKFGGSDVVATTSSMELVSGVVEELENPNTSIYTHYSIVSDDAATCRVNIACGPRYKVS